MIHILIQRYWQNEKQTEGDIQIFNKSERLLLKGVIIELPDRDNKNNISRILAGDYNVVRRWSQKYGYHLHVLDTEGRTYILIHAGNYFFNTEGCVLPGFYYSDINKDGYNDVVHSRKFLNEMLHLLPQEGIKLRIVDDIGVTI